MNAANSAMLLPKPPPAASVRGGVHRVRHPLAAHGLTFIEVTLAVALLAILSSTIFGAFGYLMGRQRIEQQKLGSMEVANRLMLERLDDENSLPAAGLPVEYGPDRYRWEMKETLVKLKPAEPANPSAIPTPPPASRLKLFDNISQVTIRVWLSEESGGSPAFTEGVPFALLTRMVYPSPTRNPDSFANARKDGSFMQKFRDMIDGNSNAGDGRGTSKSKGSKPVERR